MLSEVECSVCDEDEEPAHGDEEESGEEPHVGPICLLPFFDVVEFLAAGDEEENDKEWCDEYKVVEEEEEERVEVKVQGEKGDDGEIWRSCAGELYCGDEGAEEDDADDGCFGAVLVYFLCEYSRYGERESSAVPEEIFDFEDACEDDEESDADAEVFGDVEGDAAEEVDETKPGNEVDGEDGENVESAEEEHAFDGFVAAKEDREHKDKDADSAGINGVDGCAKGNDAECGEVCFNCHRVLQ